jgi:hypothetical protein
LRFFALGPYKLVNTPREFALLVDTYYQYKGATLQGLMPLGVYYLKIYFTNGYILYSDWFEVGCIYENLITALSNIGYDTFSSFGSLISSAIDAAANGEAQSNEFPVIKDETITLIINCKLTSGQYPNIELWSAAAAIPVSNQDTLIEGLNTITLTVTTTVDDAQFVIWNTAATNYYTGEILLIRPYSKDYLTFVFSNECDLGDILYQDDFEQTLWIESETMETTFPQEEEGAKNGEGRFVRTFVRQVKKYNVKTFEQPDFIVEVFNRMKLHDSIELTNLVGDTNTVYNLEVEHEWLFDDKYYAKIDLTFDYDEAFVTSACCEDFELPAP